jgi:ankyrin repeat protein
MHPLFPFLALFPLWAYAGPGSMENNALPLPAAKKQAPCPRLDLHAAVRYRKTSCFATALSHMDVNDRDAAGDSPLHNAIQLRNGPAIRFLVRNGADLHLRDFQGYTPRELAENLGYRRLGESLLQVERETERLYEAVDANDIVAASNSLLREASLGTRDVRLDTPLHKAAQSNLAEMAQLLIHSGARLEARNYLGETPLHAAALRDHRAVMAALIDAGANVNALDERRNTPLDISERHGDERILAMLRKKKAGNGTPASVEFDFTGDAVASGPETISR